MRTRLAGVLFAVLALGACADGARLSTLPTITPYCNPTLVWHATRDGGMRTVIYGNPFKSSQAETNQQTLSLLKLPPRFEAAPFQLLPSNSRPHDYRMVLVFNADPAWVGFQAACGDLASINLGPQSNVIAVHGSFCIGTLAITELDLIALATGPNDPAFEQLLRNLVDELLPAYGTPKQFGQPGF